MEANDDSYATRRDNLLALLKIADVPLLVALALGIYFATAYLLVDQWRWMPVAHARMLNTTELLRERGREGYHDVYFLGSSVVVDGIDCEVVDEQLPGGIESFNLGGIGTGPTRWVLQEDSLKRSHPAAVVLVFDLLSSLSNTPMARHQAAVAGWFEVTPRESRDTLAKILDPASELEPIFAPRIEQLLEFRVLPLVHFEVTVRESLRKDLRYEGHRSNFKAPWLRHTPVSPLAMTRGIQQTVEGLASKNVGDLGPALASLHEVGASLGRESVPVLVVLAPINPEVARQLPDGYLAAMSTAVNKAARDVGGEYLDHSQLLGTEDFSDHVHPIGEGRVRWSRALGEAVRSVIEGDRRGDAVSDS